MKIKTLYSSIFLCFLGILTFNSLALAEKEESRISLPADAPRVSLLGVEFVLVENVKLPEKIEIMRNRWAEIRKSHNNSLFASNNIPLPKHHQQQWKMLSSITLKKHDPLKTLRNVNGFFNSISSRKDKDFYGKNEHWATPEEFISNKSGDCEDYAITKYFALQYFKWPQKDLWLVFLHDNVNVGGHAVLVAKTGKKSFVLDNLSKPVYLLIPAEQYKNQVTPFAMANHEGLWLRITDEDKLGASSRMRSTNDVSLD